MAAPQPRVRRRHSGAPFVATALFAVFVVTGIWAIAYLRVVEDRADLYHTANAELVGAQNIVAAQVARTVESAQSLLEAVESWVRDQEAPLKPVDLAGIVARMQRRHQFPLNIRLFDADGRMMSIGDYGTEQIDASEREFIRALDAAQPGYIHIGRQILARTNGEHSIPLSMRVRPNDLGIAYVVTAIQIKPLIGIFQGLFVTAPGITGIVRDDGYVLFRFPDPESFTDRRVDLDNLVPGGVRGYRRDSGLISVRVDPAGRQVITAFRRVDLQPLYVYGSFRVDDLEAKLSERRLRTIGLAVAATLAALLMAGAVAWFVAQRERESERVRQALEDAEAANAAKREFLANVSHELRTPLNAIIGFSEFVVMQAFGPINDRYRGYVSDVLSAGKHLLGIVDQLLDLAAIEARRFAIRAEPMDPGDIAHDVAEMMRPLAAQRNVLIELARPAEPTSAFSDPGAFRQILVNLIGNAVKFCRPEGTVAVSWTRRANSGIEIAIADEGDGIPPEDIEKIFVPFWRKESSYVRRTSGTGLGLSLTRQLVERLGGTIDVESEPGRGSLFRVWLPDIEVSAAVAHEKAA